jgi:starch synthase (maltosyl-transferring)
VRLALAATLSPLYGVYSGFELCEHEPARPGSEEYRHAEKYELRPRDWDAPGNLDADLAQWNRLRREHAALRQLANLAFHHSENDQLLFYAKTAPGADLLVVVNLDPHRVQESTLHLPLELLGVAEDEPFEMEDVLTGEVFRWRGRRTYVRLDPSERVAHVLRVRRPAP